MNLVVKLFMPGHRKLPRQSAHTGRYLSGKDEIAVPAKRRPGNGTQLEVVGAAANNLNNVGCLPAALSDWREWCW